MDAFAQKVQEWETFYATLAGVSATLVGLLFVSLSLNTSFIRGPDGKHLLRIAAQSFSSFLYILTTALVFLIPEQDPLSLGITLIILGGFGFIRIVGRVVDAYKEYSPAGKVRQAIREYWLLVLAYGGMIIIAVAVLYDNYDILNYLVFVWMSLLVSAIRDAWRLLFLVSKPGS
jgi:hypothetical protein